MANQLSERDKARLLNMKKTELTTTEITRLFTKSAKMVTDDNGKTHVEMREPEFHFKDRFTLKAGEYINKTEIQTNVGKFLFNKLCIEGNLDSIIPGGYYNEVFTKKSWGKIAGWIANAVLEQRLDTDAIVRYLKAFEFYGLKLVSATSPSFTEKILRPLPEVEAEKKKLLDELAQKDHPTVADYSDIDNKLVEKAKAVIGDDPGMTLYKSGARGSFDNDYKINTVIVGPIKDPSHPSEYKMMTSNMMNGISKQDISKAADMVVSASYPKAVGTAVGGYMTKQFYSVYQSLVISDQEDCGSKYTIPVLLADDRVIESMLYQYMVLPNGKLECLTPDNSKDYRGKVMRFRSPMGCLGENFCHACIGDRFRRLDITNVGLTTGKLSNELMQKQMKKFHSIKVNVNNVDPEKLLLG